MIPLLLLSTAWARCNEELLWLPRWEAGSRGILPRGAVPWIQVDATRSGVELRTVAGGKVPVLPVGRHRVLLVPWWPLRQGARYEVWYAGQRAFSFVVGDEPDHSAPTGGALLGWYHESWLQGEGAGSGWTLGLALLDEPAWMEVDLARGEHHVRFLRQVTQPDPTSPLAKDRIRAELSPDGPRLLGGVPDALATFGYNPCGSTLPSFPRDATGELTLRFRYLDAARNTSAWSDLVPFDGDTMD